MANAQASPLERANSYATRRYCIACMPLENAIGSQNRCKYGNCLHQPNFLPCIKFEMDVRKIIAKIILNDRFTIFVQIKWIITCKRYFSSISITLKYGIYDSEQFFFYVRYRLYFSKYFEKNLDLYNW